MEEPLPLLLEGRAGVAGRLVGRGAAAAKASAEAGQLLLVGGAEGDPAVEGSTAGRFGLCRREGSERKPVSSASGRCLALLDLMEAPLVSSGDVSLSGGAGAFRACSAVSAALMISASSISSCEASISLEGCPSATGKLGSRNGALSEKLTSEGSSSSSAMPALAGSRPRCAPISAGANPNNLSPAL